ncbi:TMP-TENI-domain-containing protein [Mytilinidion resinicola]|uniref:TMP-TENI-domain-containing protein n=1 Tax=Mytilinidion resinicola TaxID=574789 RepID=A0A6A6Y7S1_9PEZI|nr:TMP-TENI-domain-containing protein [Mytilinidion resinicola]KAF2804024.1 TMP-TENI-domain-containing protein [Mytilinidion resinicola]
MALTVDYSLYLVTDSTAAILGQRDLCHVVSESILGGVTLVQYRDKTADSGAAIETAKKLLSICSGHGVPLLINDRIDVALAIDCAGVHIGQDDMDVTTARRLLGPNKIIGVTASSIEEADKAVRDGADYLGIGTVFATPTKENTKSILGVHGLRDILSHLSEQSKEHQDIKTVCIGGINASNLQRVLYQSHTPSKQLDGLAIVSAIVAAPDVQESSKHLRQLIREPPPWILPAISTDHSEWSKDTSITALLDSIPTAVQTVIEKKPISHNMTNFVVQNFAANVALSIGASPIMSTNGHESPDLAALRGGLVINMGTATPTSLENWLLAVTAYNAAGQPVILDPVGCGATAPRRATLRALLAAGYYDVIKGNESEILTVARVSGVAGVGAIQQRGVDSGNSGMGIEQKAEVVRRLAGRERNVVVMTGVVDVVSDGVRSYAVSGGHEYLGMVTGTGCSLGTVLAAFLAANKGRGDKFGATVAGIVLFGVAAGRVGETHHVHGPGTFVPAFLDQLYLASKDIAGKDETWKKLVEIRAVVG